jgi:hypothetical protein
VCSWLTISESFFKFPFALFPPIAPFADGFGSGFRRTRRLKVQSGAGLIAQAHFGEKSDFQIFARQQIDQFRDRVSRHPSALFGKFTSFHFPINFKFLLTSKTVAELHRPAKRRSPKRKICNLLLPSQPYQSQKLQASRTAFRLFAPFQCLLKDAHDAVSSFAVRFPKSL